MEINIHIKIWPYRITIWSVVCDLNKIVFFVQIKPATESKQLHNIIYNKKPILKYELYLHFLKIGLDFTASLVYNREEVNREARGAGQIQLRLKLCVSDPIT